MSFKELLETRSPTPEPVRERTETPPLPNEEPEPVAPEKQTKEVGKFGTISIIPPKSLSPVRDNEKLSQHLNVISEKETEEEKMLQPENVNNEANSAQATGWVVEQEPEACKQSVEKPPEENVPEKNTEPEVFPLRKDKPVRKKKAIATKAKLKKVESSDESSSSERCSL